VATGKVKLQLPTAGSSGRPLIIVKAHLHRPGGSPQQIASFIYFCLEAAAQFCWHPDNPDGKLSALFDLSGGRAWLGEACGARGCMQGPFCLTSPSPALAPAAGLQLKNLDATALRASFSILEQVGAAQPAVRPGGGVPAGTLRLTRRRAGPPLCPQHFPERIHDIFMYEAPTIFWGLWVSGASPGCCGAAWLRGEEGGGEEGGGGRGGLLP
jgi:hypothetical protein